MRENCLSGLGGRGRGNSCLLPTSILNPHGIRRVREKVLVSGHFYGVPFRVAAVTFAGDGVPRSLSGVPFGFGVVPCVSGCVPFAIGGVPCVISGVPWSMVQG